MEQDAVGPSLRVATFNIRHGGPPGARPDAAVTAGAVAGLGADIVGLCEVDNRSLRSRWVDQPAVIGARCAMASAFAPSRRFVLDRYGVALLVRPPGDGRAAITGVDHLAPPTVGERRILLLAEVAVPFEQVRGGRVTVGVTHLQNDEQRVRNPVDQLDWVLRELVRRPGPWVLLGDLNLEVPELGGRFARRGLTAAAAPPAFPAWSPARRIDVIAAGGGLTPGPAEVPEVLVSDHRPVVAPLVWAPL